MKENCMGKTLGERKEEVIIFDLKKFIVIVIKSGESIWRSRLVTNPLLWQLSPLIIAMVYVCTSVVGPKQNPKGLWLTAIVISRLFPSGNSNKALEDQNRSNGIFHWIQLECFKCFFKTKYEAKIGIHMYIYCR